MRRSLVEHLDYFHRFASDVAIVQHRGYRRQSIRYGDLLELAWRFAHELQARGIGKGDHVLLWGTNSAEWIATFLGCMTQGVVAVPMDRVGAPSFTRDIFERLHAKLIVASEDVVAHVADLPHIAFESLPERVANRPATPIPAPLSRLDVLQIVFTSGTTTDPRGVVTTHGNVLANLEPFESEIDKYRRYERWFHPIRFLNTVPLSHVFGQMMAIFIPPLLGGTVVFQESLNAAQIATTIRRERVSVLVSVPRLIETQREHLERTFIAKHGAGWWKRQNQRAEGEHFAHRWWRFRAAHKLLGWKFWAIVSGGATLDGATEQAFVRMSFVVLQGYGLTESTSLISVNHPFARGAGSIGKVLPGRDMKLSRDGEILVRGENIASQYWQGGGLQPVADEDGWFHTGDLGEMDPEGYLRFKGRKKTLIVTPEGLKVYPEDVERALRQDDRVRDCIVFGIDVGGNAETTAALLLEENAPAGEIVEEANGRLAPFQRVRRWYVWPERDFPRTATGKAKLGEVAQRTSAALSMTGGNSAPRPESELDQLLRGVRHDAATTTGELNLSSIERVQLMCAIEERYRLQLNETSFAEARNVDDIERIIRDSGNDGDIAAGSARATDYPYPRWQQRWPVTWMRTAAQALLVRPATWLLARPKVIGEERLREVRGPVLIVCNHVTYVDIGFVLYALPPHLRYQLAVAMEGELVMKMGSGCAVEKLSYWLVVALFNVFPLPKLSGFRESFAFAGESVDRGHSVLVFPEGMRTRDGKLLPFQRGIGMLENGLRVPIVPMRIKGLFDVAASGRHWARNGEIEIAVGEPVRYEGESPEQIAADLERRVAEL